jgi:hypothetical protein
MSQNVLMALVDPSLIARLDERETELVTKALVDEIESDVELKARLTSFVRARADEILREKV